MQLRKLSVNEHYWVASGLIRIVGDQDYETCRTEESGTCWQFIALREHVHRQNWVFLCDEAQLPLAGGFFHVLRVGVE